MIKKIALLFLLVLCSIITLYLILVSILSISTGFINIQKSGFWMPILCGLLIFFVTVFMIRLILYILRQINGKEQYPYTRRGW